MKSAMRWMVGMLAVGALAVGCTPSVDRVCEHMGELRNADRARSAESQASFRAECTAMMGGAKSANSGAYRTAARCVMGVSAGPGSHAAVNACLNPLEPFFPHH